ncbi:D-alanine--D-alanine ligase family protein [Williamsia sterculiae]|uniref:D-alanine-D-alanine ligase n=1 Tax=Williamsia sterculiae TaxID=1344003 RepID=A0A1N7H5K4_9NOCA|nr:D-alanine--D-alanine ligase [Williamsia sterculiae]SIS20071.1 D-alanine-D-alanine ligase [Williamsia sterculiae]
MRTILHLAGSPTDDFHAELSRLYAADCVSTLTDSARYRFLLAYVGPDGLWRFPAAFDPDSIAAASALPLRAALDHIAASGVDAALPQMFCRTGMTSYRALLDVLGIPYVGNTPTAMAITADKSIARSIVAGAGVDVPDAEVVRGVGATTLHPPMVVKPVDADNSVGVTLVRDPADLAAAVAVATQHSNAALVERYVELGREVRCGVVVDAGSLRCLPLEEYAVDPDVSPVRTARDKLARNESGELFLVAKDVSRAWVVPPDDPITSAVWEAARRCHVALGCRHYSLFDFRIDPVGRPWFLEAGLYNSFARGSVLTTMAAAAGIDPARLFDIALGELFA